MNTLFIKCNKSCHQLLKFMKVLQILQVYILLLQLLILQFLPFHLTSASPKIPNKKVRHRSYFLEGNNIVVGYSQRLKNDILGPPLGKEDLDRAQDIEAGNADIPINLKVDPIELANRFQGDIVLSPLQYQRILMGFPFGGSTRNAVVDDLKWPSRQIPYVISAKFGNYSRAVIASAIYEFHTKTCIRFIPRSSQVDYVHLVDGFGCSSSVGRQGGVQSVILGRGCIKKGTVIHELMHAVGFWHEHSRDDRDSYITIIWENIRDGAQFNFKKYSWTQVQNLDVGYDYGSVMHYGAYSFSKYRTRPTIIAKESVEFGQRRQLSQKDILKVNILYDCNAVTTTPTSMKQFVCQ